MVRPLTARKALAYRDERIAYWEGYERRRPGRYYHEEIRRIYRFIVPPGRSVLELGCGTGDLLAGLEPSRGVGVDFSPRKVAAARERHPDLTITAGDVHELSLEGEFDYIILSDLVNDLWDVQLVFEKVASLCHPGTRVVLNNYSRIWELPLKAVRGLGLTHPYLAQNWFTVADLENLFYLSGFEVVRKWGEILLPVPVPGLSAFFNSLVGRVEPFEFFALTNFLVARPTALSEAIRPPADPPLVSVIVPARNEAGNIDEILERVPEMGAGTELIFVEGHSTDNTGQAIENAIARSSRSNIKFLRQPGKGKGDAVRAGFAAASGEFLMILDADLTVPPEDLSRFYDALGNGKGEFVNGVRLVYPMEGRAMQFFNLLANRFFGLAFSWLLGQPIKDTLCGTKALRQSDYRLIAANRAYFGDFDPFGDFDLLFGAAKLNLRIVDIPIRYAERSYGQTNISRWKHGWLLLRMMFFALRRLKFF